MWVDAPHYYAGIVVEDGVVKDAAPILRWTINRTWEDVKRYFDKKRFKYGVA